MTSPETDIAMLSATVAAVVVTAIATRISYYLARSNRRKGDTQESPTFSFALRWDKLREARRHVGRYLLRSNLPGQSAPQLWQFYLQLGQVEEAFRNLKGDLGLRPIFHQNMERIEAHIFIAFLAYCRSCWGYDQSAGKRLG